MSPQITLRLAGALLCAASHLPGQDLPAPEEGDESSTQIAWASEAFANNLMADGVTTFEDSGDTIQFEIGTFTSGFDPTTASFDDLLLNWVVLDTTTYNNGDQQFIDTTTLYSNADPFTVGGQAYVWGFNTKDLSSGDAEWLIVSSDAWLWPSVDSPLPSTFSMSDATMAGVIVGGVNSGAYHMQLTAVPEPATATLAVLGLLALRRRRRTLEPAI